MNDRMRVGYCVITKSQQVSSGARCASRCNSDQSTDRSVLSRRLAKGEKMIGSECRAAAAIYVGSDRVRAVPAKATEFRGEPVNQLFVNLPCDENRAIWIFPEIG